MSTLKRYNGTDWEYVGGTPNFVQKLTVGTNREIELRADNEGGNIRIENPNLTNKDHWEMDTFNGDLRIYHGTENNEIDYNYTFPKGSGTYTDFTIATTKTIVNCSSSEKKIGTWYDGKPLYSRWYKATLTNTGLTNLQNITRNNYGVIWVNSYFTQNSLGSIMSGHYYYDNTDYQRMWLEGGNYVAFQGGSSFPRMPATLWYELRYTKSSD